MCELCDGKTIDQLHDRLRAAIRTIGWSVQAVESGMPGGDWAYTIGLAENYDHAELVIVGQRPTRAAAMLNAMASMVANGERLGAGELVGLNSGEDEHVFRLVDVHPGHVERGLVNSWFNYYAEHDDPPPLVVRQAAMFDPRYCECHQPTKNGLDNPAAVIGNGGKGQRRPKRRRPKKRR
jgi:hypothetical protein